jgi:hypothetical protein
MKKLVLILVLMVLSMSAFGQEVAEAPVEPAFEFVKQLIQFLLTTFPKAGPIVQGFSEIVGGVAALFTLLAVFVAGVLKIPYILAHWAKAPELAEKIQKFSDKITPYFKFLSIFNVQKKK